MDRLGRRCEAKAATAGKLFPFTKLLKTQSQTEGLHSQLSKFRLIYLPSPDGDVASIRRVEETFHPAGARLRLASNTTWNREEKEPSPNTKYSDGQRDGSRVALITGRPAEQRQWEQRGGAAEDGEDKMKDVTERPNGCCCCCCVKRQTAFITAHNVSLNNR